MGEKRYTVTEWDDGTDPKPLPPMNPAWIGLGLSALAMGLEGSGFDLVRSREQPTPKPKRNPKASKQKAQKAARKAARRKP